MVRAFLEGRVAGRAYVDNDREPQSCAIAVNYRVVFFGGAHNLRFRVRAIARFRRDEELFVVWPENTWFRPWRLRPASITQRIEFRSRANQGGSQLKGLQGAAGNCTIKRIDGRLLARCIWRDEVVQAVGSASEFFTQGFGFCLMAGHVIAAEAYACFWGNGKVEIVTVTHPEFRQRGFAGAACAHLIESCEALGLETYWCCDPKNRASMRLAAKLGFTNPRRFGLLRYDRASVDSMSSA
jgi:RimJ/RimL family protein N-acetyltransferase